MARSVPHRLIAPIPHPHLVELMVWVVAAILMVAWFTVWVRPAF